MRAEKIRSKPLQELTDILSTVDASIRNLCSLLSNISISRDIMLSRLILQTLPRRPKRFRKLFNFFRRWRMNQSAIHQNPRSIRVRIPTPEKPKQKLH